MRVAAIWRELVAQHDALRLMMEDCERRLSQDADGAAQILAQLRTAFVVHDRYETESVGVLLMTNAHASILDIGERLAAHLATQRAMRRLVTTLSVVTAPSALVTLRAHLDHEELTLYPPRPS